MTTLADLFSDKELPFQSPSEDEKDAFIGISSGANYALQSVAAGRVTNAPTLQNYVDHDAARFCMIANHEDLAYKGAKILSVKMEALPEYKAKMEKENPLVFRMIQDWAAEGAQMQQPYVQPASQKWTADEHNASSEICERANALSRHRLPDATVRKYAEQDSRDFTTLSGNEKLAIQTLYEIHWNTENDPRYRTAMQDANPALLRAADRAIADNHAFADRNWSATLTDKVLAFAEGIGIGAAVPAKIAGPAVSAPASPNL
ncbi:MAG: hypothetical protein EPN97_17785 [Alphaproteobacteria bacterium]|nr:MAG: hypothetical protein EPN97_17785 [Alphaproteobacteria bacterium]